MQQRTPQDKANLSAPSTGQDPQNRQSIISSLEENNVLVMPSNADAAEIVSLIIKEIS